MRESYPVVQGVVEQYHDQPRHAADQAVLDECCQGQPGKAPHPASQALDLVLEQDGLVAFVRVYVIPDTTSLLGELDSHLK